MPFEQNLNVPVEEMTFFMRTAGDPLSYASTVWIVHQADARIPVTNLGTQTSQIDNEMSQQILFARLCTGFAILALAIACVGLYGTMSYMVARRTGEIGIRMALGAQRGTVVWMVLREVIVLAAVGLSISVLAALGTSKLIESFLFGVKHNDPGGPRAGSGDSPGGRAPGWLRARARRISNRPDGRGPLRVISPGIPPFTWTAAPL